MMFDALEESAQEWRQGERKGGNSDYGEDDPE